MHPARYSWRDELPATLVRLLGYLGGIVLLSVATAKQEIALKKANGVDKVEASCQACHSLSYIPMNSPFINAVGWSAEANKMINVMGARIDEPDAKAIAEYMAKNYGS